MGNKNNEHSASNEMNEVRRSKKSLAQRAKENGAIPHDKFAQEWMRRLENRFKK